MHRRPRRLCPSVKVLVEEDGHVGCVLVNLVLGVKVGQESVHDRRTLGLSQPTLPKIGCDFGFADLCKQDAPITTLAKCLGDRMDCV